MSTTDTDPTPAHGTPRPSKFRTLNRLHEQLLITRLDNDTRIAELMGQVTDLNVDITRLVQLSHDLTADINDIEQLLIDMAPEA